MAVRGLEENTSLIKYLISHLDSKNDRERMNIFKNQVEQTERYANILRKMITDNKSGME